MTELLKKNDESQNEFKASNLTISTCTVLCNLNSKINLEYFTRFVPIYDQDAPELDLKSGGIYNMEFYGNCARGETLVDKIKDEFNNQTTIKFKYWGFRNVNVKVFRNGKLQMTGLKHEDEALVIGNLLIDIIKNINIAILDDIKDIINAKPTFDMQLVYNESSSNQAKITYYRKYYNRFLKNYNFNLEELYDLNQAEKKSKQQAINTTSNTTSDTIDKKKKKNTMCDSNLSFDITKKNFVRGIHDIYSDSLETANQSFLQDNEWFGDNTILKIIDMIEYSKILIENELDEVLSSSKNIWELKDKVNDLFKRYSDFKVPSLVMILDNISKNLYSTNEQTLKDLKMEIYQYLKIYKTLLDKKINRLIAIRNSDITICNNLEKYLDINLDSNLNQAKDKSKDQSKDFKKTVVNICDLDTSNTIYTVSNIETVLINSDLSVNFNINLKKTAKILKKKSLFNTYDPDEHSGINLKYYWNKDNEIQGFCHCNPHCSTKEKKSVCTKITILIFRPGSIIITGSRNLEQLRAAHQFILKILQDHMSSIKIDDNSDDTKQIAILNNEFRKISRKPRVFYIKKTNIII